MQSALDQDTGNTMGIPWNTMDTGNTMGTTVLQGIPWVPQY